MTLQDRLPYLTIAEVQTLYNETRIRIVKDNSYRTYGNPKIFKLTWEIKEGAK